MNTDFHEKVVVITGASRGLGKELALAFAKEGAIVVINYRSNNTEALNTLKQLQIYNKNCSMFCADVTQDNDVAQMYSFIKNAYGKVDILINNAGVTDDDYVNLMSKNQWDYVLSTNLTGVFLCTRYLSKLMIKNQSGKIINIASLKGQLGSEGQANYAASKAGVIGFSVSLAKELGSLGISVNVVCPGYIETDLNRGNNNKSVIAKQMSAMDISNNLTDYINFTLFIASDNIKGISGQVFNIDSRIL